MKIRSDGIMDPEGKYPNPFTKREYTDFYRNVAKGWSDYRTWKDHMEIFRKLYYNNIVLVIAGTGVGKTVILPKLLAHYFHYTTPILVATPRQKTTEGAADWAAKCMDVPLYYYQMKGKFATNVLDRNGDPIRTGNAYIGMKHGGIEPIYDARKTKLLYCTDSTIKQMIIQGDELLSRYGGIIIDEAHERSVSIDILIALVVEIIKKRSDFKVIIMSATVNEQVFIDYFKRSGLEKVFTIYNPESPGQHPIEPVWLDKKVKANDYIPKAIEIVEEIVKNPKMIPINNKGDMGLGDILVFVSSGPEGQTIKKHILKNMNTYPQDAKPYPVILQSKSKELEKEIALSMNGLDKVPPNEGVFHRKLIIATNVAESSVTFEDPLVYVIETGVEFNSSYDAGKYANIGGIKFVAKANMKQRCGRTGRTCPGFCYKIYTEEQYEKEVIDYPPPKITVTDLTDEYLSILCLKDYRTVAKTSYFLSKMIEPYDNIKLQVEVAIKNLYQLGVISDSGKLRSIGIVLNKFGKFDYQVGKMIIAGYYFGCMPECIALGAILTTIQSVDKMFNKPLDTTDQNQQKELTDTMMKFKHDSGDHLTCLNFFLQWYYSYNRDQFENDHKLNHDIMKMINMHYEEILELLREVAELIPKLKLFKTDVDKLFGGGQRKVLKNNLKSKSFIKNNNDNRNCTKSKFSNYHSGGYTSGKRDQEINIMSGGYNEFSDRFLNEFEFDQGILQEGSGGRNRKGKGPGLGPGKFGLKPPPNQGKGKLGPQTKKNFGKGKGQGQGQKKKTQKKTFTAEEKEHHKKLKTIIEKYTLKDLAKEKKINVFEDKNKNILTCLLYGFTNHLGIYTGNGNDFVIKFSNEIPMIDSKSMLRKMDKKVKFIIYHQFMIMNGQNKLSMVSNIDKEILSVFM